MLITSDYYFYNGKKINILEKVDDILNKLTSVKKVIVFPYDKNEKVVTKNFINFEDALSKSNFDETFERFEFNHISYALVG